MDGSSAERVTILARVRPRQIFCLLEILQNATVRQRTFIAARFEEQARHFPETLQLLEGLGWVRTSGDSLLTSGTTATRILAVPSTQRGLVLAEALVDDLGAYEPLFADYLNRFNCQDSAYVYHSDGERRLQESPVRDFLMELGAVVHRPEDDYYVLAERFAFLHLWARNVRGLAGQGEFDQILENREQLGREAELVVLEWEKHRVGPPWKERVRHVSARSPAACYDIQSVTINGAAVGLRFIEVKAVAGDSYQFHWSTVEIEAARVLGDRYFLYLLPACGTRGFDLEKMAVIQNPFVSVFQNPLVWSKEESEIICRRREEISS